MSTLRKLQDTDVFGKTVLYRSPYDIALEQKDGAYVLSDDSRMTATLPTLTYLLQKQCKIVILAHIGRPAGKVDEALRTTPLAKHLSELLMLWKQRNTPVATLQECVGDEVTTYISQMSAGQIVMLENTRFHAEDDVDDDTFARQLCLNGEIVVHDGFPQAHRHQASVTGILRHLPSCAGLYFQKEYEQLSHLLEHVEHPFTVIIGGAKISDKTESIKNLSNKVDMFLVGGGVANVFLKAKGKAIGSSYIEEVPVESGKNDWVEFARTLLDRKLSGEQIEQYGNDLFEKVSPVVVQIPQDVRIETSKKTVVEKQVVDSEALAVEGDRILDIGSLTESFYSNVISRSKTVFWNGPLGMIEDERFSQGSYSVAAAMARSQANTSIAGGDTIAAAKSAIDLIDITHVSLAGGAALELLAGNKLPAVELLST